MKGPAVLEKARLYPLFDTAVSTLVEDRLKSYCTHQKNHWKLTTATDMIDSHIKESADLRRASPE